MDSSTQKVFVFAGTSTSAAMVVQTDTQLSNVGASLCGGGTSPSPCVATTIGGTSIAQVHSGAFDNNYFNNPFDGSSTSGSLYVCGNSQGGNNHTALRRIGFSTTGTMSATNDGSNYALAAGSNQPQCSPLTEIFNTASSTDWLFAGLDANCQLGNAASFTGGCVLSFNITGTPSSVFPASKDDFRRREAPPCTSPK